ncbi:MAG: catecholate siderophore receptor Fiu [Thermomonas sp.]|uniref:catecholate siderophore receptor Fiu n=1 Tax=Thermomonas sp. TaxID=1971895 RepID=UPI0039E2D777
MTHIKSRKHAVRRTHTHLATTALTAGLALAMPLMAHAADDSADADKAKQDAKTLDKVEVRGLRSFIVSPKFTQTLQDTPQTIQVIGEELLQEQGATTLTEALRNSPAVGTFYAGENGNTSTGDTVYMRGFDSTSSIFVDGVRDLGSIARDLFNVEQVEVVKGPAGSDTGRSAPTGAINMATKQAQLREKLGGSVSVGSDGQKRATADWNTALGASAALRLNAMWQDSDVPGRDHVNNSRFGFAPSLGFGLNGNTRVWLNLLYVKQDNVPDGFVPTVGLPGWTPQPGLENLVGHPVDPSNFYGTRDDHDKVTAQMATLRFEHDFSETLKLSNTLRWGQTDQDYLLTAFMGTSNAAGTGNIKWTDQSDLSTYTLARSLNTFKDQQNAILTDQLNLRADFSTGAVDHFLSIGLEYAREEQDIYSLAATGTRPPANLYNPDWNDAGTLTWAHTGASNHGKTETTSAYLFDTLKFGEHFQVTAGVRSDRYKTRYTTITAAGVATPLQATGTLTNWKLGVIYKPVDALSLYANVAQSQQPPGGANFQLSTSANSANNPNLDPQKAKTTEIGGKWQLTESGLMLNLALFRTDVTNEISGSAAEGWFQDGKKHVKGVELSMGGNITENWALTAGYTRQDTTVSNPANGTLPTADGTNNLTYTPGDAFTSWTTYKLPFGLTIGGGVRYTAGLHRGTDGAVGTPKFTKSWTVYDMVLSYPVNDNISLRLNGYNLFDKHYVASINKSGYRYTPGTPRTFLLSADFRF